MLEIQLLSLSLIVAKYSKEIIIQKDFFTNILSKTHTAEKTRTFLSRSLQICRQSFPLYLHLKTRSLNNTFVKFTLIIIGFTFHLLFQ